MANMQAFDEETLIAAIGTVLETATGLKAYKLPDPAMETPAAIPMMAPEWNAGFGGTVKSPVECSILILTAPGDYVSGALTLFEYTSATADRSVKLALEADPTLGGEINGLRVVGPEAKLYERYNTEGELVLLGRTIRVNLFI